LVRGSLTPGISGVSPSAGIWPVRRALASGLGALASSRILRRPSLTRFGASRRVDAAGDTGLDLAERDLAADVMAVSRLVPQACCRS